MCPAFTERMKKMVGAIPPELALILLLSLIVGAIGICWGTPNLWHPDEFIRFILSMGQRKTLNPHYFSNPDLPIYLGSALVVPYFGYLFLFRQDLLVSLSSLPREAGSLSQVPAEFMSTTIILVRLMSLIVSLIAIVVIYNVGEQAFNRRISLLACLLLALSPLFIPHQKYATVEIYLLLFLWLSLLFQQRYLKEGKQRDLSIAALFAGLAMASKYTGVFGAFFLIVTVLLKERPKTLTGFFRTVFSRRLITAGLIAGIAFLLVNPWPVIAFREVMAAFQYEGLSHAWSTGVQKIAWNPSVPKVRGLFVYPGLAFRGLTPPLFMLALLGVALLFLKRRKNAHPLEGESSLQLHLLLFLLAYYGLFVGAWVTSFSRYLLPVAPVLLLFAAAAMARLWSRRGNARTILRPALALIIIFSAASAAFMEYEFLNDSRYAAAGWLQDSVRTGQTIGYFAQQTVYLPEFPKRAQAVFIPFVSDSSLSDGSLFEEAAKLEMSGPDYLVLSSLYYRRFYGPEPTARTEFYDSLLSGNYPPYIVVAEFTPPRPLGFAAPSDDLGNPVITILERQAQ